MEELIDKLKGEIIVQLNLDLKKEDIDAQAPLFGPGLGLDSIDALELNILMERNYGIKIPNPHVARKVYQSIFTMAEYISDNKPVE